MKLSKIYSNNPLFEPILFNDGFNVIYGDVEREVVNQSTNEVREHNLGKTSFVCLVDFMLLKKMDKNQLFGKYKEKFASFVFFLEIKLNNGKYLTIKRAIVNNSKISLKEHFAKYQDFTSESDWTYSNLALNAEEDISNPKKILQRYLQFDVAQDFSYRSFLPYILRSQHDYSEVFLMEDSNLRQDRTSLLFNLLGYDHKFLQEKYSLDEDVKREKEAISVLQSKDKSEEVYKIKAAIEAKEIEKSELKKEIGEFDFYQKEQDINFDLVKRIESSVSQLNKKEYSLAYSIDRIRNSLDSNNKPTLEIQDIKQLFQEVEINFPDSLSKSYEDVAKFSSQITKEREKYLQDDLKESESQLEEVKSELKKLNKERIDALSLLKEDDTFIKQQKHCEELLKVESEILSYRNRLADLERAATHQKLIDDLKEKIKKLAISIKQELDKENKSFQDIKAIFQGIYRETFEYTALLFLEPNKRSGNIEFNADVLDKNSKITGKGEGNTSTRVLCVSFVLAILAHYSSKSFFRFSYNDGLLDNWANNHKVQFMNLIRDYCEKYGVQYIVSLIKSDIPAGYEFKENEIVRKLSKTSTLFGIEF
jgi:uncharacterized protein YydD (DUF2326 family)